MPETVLPPTTVLGEFSSVTFLQVYSVVSPVTAVVSRSHKI